MKRCSPRMALMVGVLLAAGPSRAASFTAGDLAVYRVGDGSGPLTNTGNAVFVDEYTADGTLVQSVELPVAPSSGVNPLVASGTATSEGQMTRSADGRFLVLTGYASALPAAGSLSGSAGSAVPRTVGTIKFDGSIDTTTALIDFADANNPRAATSTDGLDLWVGGGAGGIRYTTLGSTTSVDLNADNPNIRAVAIADAELYMSTQRGTTLRIGPVGSGTPTSGEQTIANLPGFPTANSPNAFFFADLDGAPGVDTLYVADDAAGLTKFALVGGAWVARGAAGSGADAYRGVTGIVSGSVVTLFATRKGGGGAGGGGELAKLVDGSGYNGSLVGTPTRLTTAPSNTAFRGVAMAPVAPRIDQIVAHGDTYSAAQGTPLSVAAADGVLHNDTGSPLTLITHTAPAHGTLSMRADGSFVYAPDSGYVGSDFFAYTATDAVRIYATNVPPLATFNGVAITGGGFGSGIAPVPGAPNEIYGLTDLGPHVGGPGSADIVPLPTFVPSIARFALSGVDAVRQQTIALKNGAGTPFSGRENPQHPTGETLKDLNGIVLGSDVNGYDPEGLVALADGTFWVSDEYGPFVSHFDANGNQLSRLSPLDSSLPAELARRDAGRGLEGLTVTPDGSLLVAMMQSALDQPDLASGDPQHVAIVRIVTYGLIDAALHEYLYLLDDPLDHKTSVSEVTALSNSTFAADERDGDFPPGSYKKLWKFDLTGATDIGPASSVAGATYNGGSGGLLIWGLSLEALVDGQDSATARSTLAAHSITPVQKALYVDVGGTLDGLDPTGGFFSHDKFEGVALLDGGATLLISNDSDFGIDGVTNNAPPFQLAAKVSPVTGVQDDGEYLAVTLSHLPVVTSSAAVSIQVAAAASPTPTSTPTGACPATPVASCLEAGASTLTLNAHADAAKRSLDWKWGQGAAVSAADVGDPLSADDYSLCVYGDTTLLLGVTAPHGALWTAKHGVPPSRYLYKDKLGSHDGVTKVALGLAVAGKAKLHLKAKGAGIPSLMLPIPAASLPITVQLRNSSGAQCWSASYLGVPKKNDDARLRLTLQ